MTGPRLPELTPDGVALAACTAIAEHWGRMVARLSPALPPDPATAVAALERESLPAAVWLAGDGREHAMRAWGLGWRAGTELDAAALAAGSDLGATLRDLTVYAQTGALGDWGDDAGALDASQSVHEALYRAPGLSVTATPLEYDLADEPDTAWGVVLLAAHARYRLAVGQPVTVRDLAALLGVSTGRVRQLIAPGYGEGAVARPSKRTAGRGRASTLAPAAPHRLLVSQATDEAALPAGARGVYCCGGGRRWMRAA